MKNINQHITTIKRASAFGLMLVVLLSFTTHAFGNNINNNSNKANTTTLVKTSTFIPTDAKATRETKLLYNNMMHLGKNKKVLFGHQDDLAYGSTWKYNTANKGNLHVSDTKDVVGDLPALFGWDLGQYYPDSLNYMINGVLKNDLKKFITSAYLNGGINTISWHCDNPLTRGRFNDCNSNTVHAILTDKATHETFIKWLGYVADFIGDLKVNGVQIPVIFRPFHESNLNNCFWWDNGACGAEEYKALWKLTVTYLRDTRQLHNILFAFSVNDGFTTESFSSKFSQEYVDIIGFDIYQRVNSFIEMKSFISRTRTNCLNMASIAAKYGKVPAITEIGADNVQYSKWWTEGFLPAINNMPVAYALLWRNPYKAVDASASYSVSANNSSVNDFIDMYNNNPQIIFCKDAAALNLYR